MTALRFGVDSRCVRCGGSGRYHERSCLLCNGQGVIVRARSTDPLTSRTAANSVEHIRDSQRVILEALRNAGPSTDEELWAMAGVRSRCSPSGARSRRKELVDAGLVKDSGRKATTVAGRSTTIWEAA